MKPLSPITKGSGVFKLYRDRHKTYTISSDLDVASCVQPNRCDMQ